MPRLSWRKYIQKVRYNTHITYIIWSRVVSHFCCLFLGFDVDSVITDIKESIERDTAAENSFGWDIIFKPTPAFRRIMVVGVSTAVSQQAVGIDAIQYFLIDILNQSGVSGQLQQTMILIFLGIIKLAFIVVGGKLFDRKGRRPLFFVSFAGEYRDPSTVYTNDLLLHAYSRILTYTIPAFSF